MVQGTKIRWSSVELAAAEAPDFFYIKHAVIGKVTDLFSEFSGELKKAAELFPGLNGHTDVATPKLFRGENYLQLPYVVLDYPRRFSGTTVFAFRSMFWWGKEFSFTLHLQGEALDRSRNPLTRRIRDLAGKNFYWCVNESPWQYYFKEDNYILLDDCQDAETQIVTKNFIKISRKLPVREYEKVADYGMETFKLLAGLVE